MAPPPGQGEARTISPALRRGVRMELVVAPASLFVVMVVGLTFVTLGLQHGALHYVGLGVVVMVANLTFGFLMVRTALRFLRATRPWARARKGAEEE